jgi:hypothetical protein
MKKGKQTKPEGNQYLNRQYDKHSNHSRKGYVVSATVVIVNNLDEAQREIEAALADGDVKGALGVTQCLRAFCGCEEELSDLLKSFLNPAWNHHAHLTLNDVVEFVLGLNLVADLASEEGFLAVA